MKGVGRTVRKRRKDGKTDYKLRLGLLKSGNARVVVRKTNRYITAQVVKSDIAQDKVVTFVSSKNLIGNGWPSSLAGSLKSLPAAYLTGYLLGKKSTEIKQGILDIGLQRNIKGSRLYAFLKGLVDSGFLISHDEKVLPSDEKLQKSERTGKLINEIKENLG